MECYSAIKKKEILPFATTWVDLEGIMLSEISQAERDILDDLMWNLKRKQHTHTKRTDTVLLPDTPKSRDSPPVDM